MATSQPASIITPPAATSSSTIPGSSCSIARTPMASNAWTWLPWGTPARGAGRSGSSSLSTMTTSSKAPWSAVAVSRPPMLPPMTVARRDMETPLDHWYRKQDSRRYHPRARARSHHPAPVRSSQVSAHSIEWSSDLESIPDVLTERQRRARYDQRRRTAGGAPGHGHPGSRRDLPAGHPGGDRRDPSRAGDGAPVREGRTADGPRAVRRAAHRAGAELPALRHGDRGGDPRAGPLHAGDPLRRRLPVQRRLGQLPQQLHRDPALHQRQDQPLARVRQPRDQPPDERAPRGRRYRDMSSRRRPVERALADRRVRDVLISADVLHSAVRTTRGPHLTPTAVSWEA